MKKKQKKFLIKSFLLAVVSLALTLLISFVSDRLESEPIKRIEDSIYDLAFRGRSKNNQFKTVRPEDILIIDVDDESIKELGRVNSWPRLYDAHVIEFLGACRPFVIGVDFLYTEPDTLPRIYNQLLKARGIKESDQAIEFLSTDDSLSQAIAGAQVVYLSAFADPKDSSEFEIGYLSHFKIKSSPDMAIKNVGRINMPISTLARHALGVGTIQMDSDYDGMLRNYPLIHTIKHKSTKDSLALAGNFPFFMWADLIGADLSKAYIMNRKLFVLDSLHVPLNKDGSFRINWLGADQEIRHIPFYKVLTHMLDSSNFKDKVIFLGTSASGMEDIKSVPYSNTRIPGVDVHAIAFLNIANQAYINEKSFARFLPVIALVIFITAMMMSYIRPIYALFLLGTLLTATFFSIFPLFNAFSLKFPVVTLMLGGLVSGMVSMTYNYFTEQIQKKQLKNAFGTYVSSTVVNKIIEDPKSLMLGGTKKTLSVLFSDIRGFTKYSERMDPQLVVSIINKYLSTMSEPVLAHEGTIDKFIGDAIFAIFGAPLDNSDHATEACEVALEMIQKLKDVNTYLIGEGYGPLKIGIGLNTGEMTIGNIGSEKRFDYTAIGDSVNLGSRIEGLTKHFNVNILVSEFTKEACQQHQFLFRALPATRVQGKELTVGIYELMDTAANRNLYEPGISLWEEAHAAFMSKDLTKALALFEQYQEGHPQDISTSIYIEKCKEYLIHPEEFSNSIDMDKK